MTEKYLKVNLYEENFLSCIYNNTVIYIFYTGVNDYVRNLIRVVRGNVPISHIQMNFIYLNYNDFMHNGIREIR